MKKLVLAVLFSLSSVALHAQTTSTVVHPAWSKNAAIYEANIRQFSPEGSFKKFEAYLPELQKMGVGIIWIMPVNPIGVKNRKGTLGSYYAVSDYRGINPEFGSAADFKQLVQQIHAHGMKVILDWVPNHTAWDHPWTISHPDYFERNAKGEFTPPVPDWQDVIKLNYANPALRKEMIDIMKYWLTEYDIDGYRMDVADGVPVDFWDVARVELDKVKPVFMLAESSDPKLQAHAFDMTYGWQFKDLFGEIAQGKKNAHDLDLYLAGEESKYHPNSYRMLHITNHDLNSWEGTEFVRLGNGTEAFLVLSNLIKGMPLLYQGQEAGNAKALAFFERDPVQWQDHKFKAIYTKLFQLKKTNQALWNGTDGGQLVRMVTGHDDNIFAFTRDKGSDGVIGVFNLSAKPQVFFVPAKITGTDLFSGTAMMWEAGTRIVLQPWEYRVLVK